ncbi:hypothetical protein PHPALM_28229 [Phytophthora palmivora]|uniref:RxLR effector protein n=1 Tax=Phytophthora palmivora TaxID=4796 RepID=A0A2P4XAN7_9STRA|nr:hypothetical protein PHPALM_28229 [Phytophthora palmivora]
MHMTFVLLAAMAVISGSAAIDTKSTSVSNETLTSQVHAIDSVANDGDMNRFLRSHQTPIDGDQGFEHVKDDTEERLSSDALAKLLKGYISHKFDLWKRKGYSGSTIWNKLDIDSHPSRRWIYDNYVLHFS